VSDDPNNQDIDLSLPTQSEQLELRIMKFPRCPRCRQHIYAGEVITWYEGLKIHAACAPKEPIQ
jgi:hypothetical protein